MGIWSGEQPSLVNDQSRIAERGSALAMNAFCNQWRRSATGNEKPPIQYVPDMANASVPPMPIFFFPVVNLPHGRLPVPSIAANGVVHHARNQLSIRVIGTPSAVPPAERDWNVLVAAHVMQFKAISKKTVCHVISGPGSSQRISQTRSL